MLKVLVEPRPLPRKAARTIDRALVQLQKIHCYKPITSVEDLKGQTIGRLLQLSDHRAVLLTDFGLTQFDQIVDKLVEVDPFEKLANQSDIRSASWATFEELLSNGQAAESADEWLSLVAARIAPQIRVRQFVVPLVGIRFKDIDELVIGSFRLVLPSIAHLDASGADHQWAEMSKYIKGYRDGELWLQGQFTGTPDVANAGFEVHADLVAGLLAVAAAVLLKSGATRIFISPGMGRHDRRAGSTWFSWAEPGENFTVHHGWARGQPFEIDEGLRQQLHEASTISTAARIFESKNRTPLEEAIARGFHWYADAHRDPAPVMQFVKYWSCVETFFTLDVRDITKSVSAGLAAVLTFGGFKFVLPDDYLDFKASVADLYGMRSRALHRASRSHITERSVAELSRRAAQLLLNASSLVEMGYRTLDEIREHSVRLDAQMERARTRRATNEAAAASSVESNFDEGGVGLLDGR